MKSDFTRQRIKTLMLRIRRKIMIKTFRIDERLIHGQVIATWLKTLGITHLIVANDQAASDEIQKSALKMAVPSGVKCLIKSIDDAARILKDPRCNSMSIMLIVGSPEDAVRLMPLVDGIPEVNLANFGSITKPDVPDKLAISNMVYLDADDIKAVNQIISFGKPLFTQKTPSEPRKIIKQL